VYECPIALDGLQSCRLDIPEGCEIMVDLSIFMNVVLCGVCPPKNESGQFKLIADRE